jgi:hypothetical protein
MKPVPTQTPTGPPRTLSRPRPWDQAPTGPAARPWTGCPATHFQTAPYRLAT